MSALPLTVLETMQRHGCKRFIFSSTCATYGDPVMMPIDETRPQQPVNPYGASKWMLERVLKDCGRAWGLECVFLRSSMLAAAIQTAPLAKTMTLKHT